VSGSALGATFLLKSVSANHDWPTKYLCELSRFARTGGVRAFFESLNEADIEFAEARRGATSVFEALAS